MANELNGIDVGGLREFTAKVKQDSREGLATFGVTSKWKGQARIEAEVNSLIFAGDEIERSFNIVTDEPPELLGGNSAPNPQETLMAAVNACIMVSFVAFAADRGIELKKLEIKTSGQLDLRGFLGLDPDIPAGYPSLEYEVTISSNATRAQLEDLHEHVKKTSPNYFNMTERVPMNGTLVVEEAVAEACQVSANS